VPAYELKWNFRRANYETINDYLGGIVWDEVLDGTGIEDAIDVLYYHLNFVIDAYVPRFSVRRSSYGHPVWFSAKLISLMKAKKVAHLKFKNSYCHADYLSFTQLRAQCKSLSAKCMNNTCMNTFVTQRMRSPIMLIFFGILLIL